MEDCTSFYSHRIQVKQLIRYIGSEACWNWVKKKMSTGLIIFDQTPNDEAFVVVKRDLPAILNKIFFFILIHVCYYLKPQTLSKE